MRKLEQAAIVAISLMTSSCGSVMGVFSWDRPCTKEGNLPTFYYSGVQMDFLVAKESFTSSSPGFGVLVLLDIPFSFIGDTILIPATIEAKNGHEKQCASLLANDHNKK
jgi:uncharacterized protein YceK